jgi:hypothetical protein
MGPTGPDDMEIGPLCPAPDPTFAGIRVQPTAFNLRVGLTVQLQVTPVDAQGSYVFCAPPLTVTSTDPSVATVSSTGLVTGIGAGKVVIRASAGGKSDSATVTVVNTTIASVSIQRAPASLLVGQTVGLAVLARDNEGNVITPQWTGWRTDDATIATVAPSGMLIAVGEGTATVTAEAEGLTNSVRIPITRDAPAVRFLQIASGFEHTCAIVSGGRFADGTAFCWGNGTSGQLGIGQIGVTGTPYPVSGGLTFSFIAAGDNTSCALNANGESYCWGANEAGQLGDGTTVNRLVPTRVATPVAFRSLALGGSITCGLGVDGVAYCWGLVGTTKVSVPTPVPGGLKFVELTAGGGSFVCGRTTEGRAFCWGSTYSWAGTTPTAVQGNVMFSQISAGNYHVCGVSIADGQGYCWGRMDGQQLGQSVGSGSRIIPVAVPGGLRFTSIAAGGSFTCGVTASGSYCIGPTYLSNVDRSNPTRIPLEDRHPFVTIAAGTMHSCAIDTKGGGWCWGRTFEGQVGAGEPMAGPGDPLQLRIQ